TTCSLTSISPTPTPPLSLHDALPIYLVADEQIGPRGKRPCDRHALALPARELHRKAVAEPGGQLHPLEQLADLPLGVRPREPARSEEHTSELQSRVDLVCRLLLEKKK